MFSLGTDTGDLFVNPPILRMRWAKSHLWKGIPLGSHFVCEQLRHHWSFDENGRRCGVCAEIIAGKDLKDSTTPHIPVPKYTESLSQDITGKVIGLPKEFLTAKGMGEEVRQETEKAAKMLEQRGAKNSKFPFRLRNTPFRHTTCSSKQKRAPILQNTMVFDLDHLPNRMI